jgi:hypothetical protein
MRWSRAASETARPRPQQEPAARWSDLVLPDLDAEALSPAPIRRAAAVGIPWLSDSATKRTSGLSPFVHLESAGTARERYCSQIGKQRRQQNFQPVPRFLTRPL